MHYACHHGAVQSILALLRPRCTLAKVADVHARTFMGETALHFASANNFSHIVRILLEAGADIHAQSSNGQTPLHFAASAGATASMRALLDMGACIDSGEIDFLTPLHLASLHGRCECSCLVPCFSSQVFYCSANLRQTLLVCKTNYRHHQTIWNRYRNTHVSMTVKTGSVSLPSRVNLWVFFKCHSRRF